MQLTEHFSLGEMTLSQTAARRGLDNTPDPRSLENLRALCGELLEPIRLHFEEVVSISSGYRGPELNAAIGGAKGSQHMTGQAADFNVDGYSVAEIFDWLRTTSNLDYDQIIDEFGEWIHISYRADGGNRGVALRARRFDGRVAYSPVEDGAVG